MKSDREKTKKHRQPETPKPLRPPCGTLAYLAECRSMVRKAETVRRPDPRAADMMTKM